MNFSLNLRWLLNLKRRKDEKMNWPLQGENGKSKRAWNPHASNKRQLQRWCEPRPLMRSSGSVMSISYQIYPLKNPVSVLKNLSAANWGNLVLVVKNLAHYDSPPLVSRLT